MVNRAPAGPGGTPRAPSPSETVLWAREPAQEDAPDGTVVFRVSKLPLTVNARFGDFYPVMAGFTQVEIGVDLPLWVAKAPGETDLEALLRGVEAFGLELQDLSQRLGQTALGTYLPRVGKYPVSNRSAGDL